MHFSNGRTQRFVERFLIIQTLVVVAACTLSYGGKASWSRSMTFMLTLLSLIPLVVAWRDPRQVLTPLWRRLLPFAPFLLYTLYLVIALLNPSHDPNPAGGWMARPSWNPWLPTVLDRDLALKHSLPWLAALLQGGAILALLSPRSLRRLNLGLLFFCLALALFGSVLWFSGSKAVMGLQYVKESSPFASFVYRNHWAAFGLLGASLAAGVAFRAWDHAGQDPREQGTRLFGFSALILILLTLPLPGSRSGTLLGLFLLALVLFTAALRFLRSPRYSATLKRWGLAGVAIAGVGLIGYTAWVGGKIVERELITRSEIQWKQSPELDSLLGGRLEAAKSTWRMANVRPLWGWGPGSFDPVFPLYQSPKLKTPKGDMMHFGEAHCDWAQMGAEYGRVGALSLLALLGAAAYLILRWGNSSARWRLVGIGLVLLLAIGEFPLQNPAVLLLFFVLLFSASANALHAARAARSRQRGKLKED